ncbi:unnamed protein product [Lampetra fluviatilis]
MGWQDDRGGGGTGGSSLPDRRCPARREADHRHRGYRIPTQAASLAAMPAWVQVLAFTLPQLYEHSLRIKAHITDDCHNTTARTLVKQVDDSTQLPSRVPWNGSPH